MNSSTDEGPGHYDAETQTYRLHHDWGSDDRLSTVIIDAVAAVTDTEPTDIGPLYNVIDPEALEQVFAPTPTSTRCHAASYLSFSLHDCEVTVASDGLIEIQIPDS